MGLDTGLAAGLRSGVEAGDGTDTGEEAGAFGDATAAAASGEMLGGADAASSDWGLRGIDLGLGTLSLGGGGMASLLPSFRDRVTSMMKMSSVTKMPPPTHTMR